MYLPTWMVDFDGFHVGKYTSPMDSMAFQKGYTPIFDPSCFVPTEGTQVMALVGTAKSNRNFTSNSKPMKL